MKGEDPIAVEDVLPDVRDGLTRKERIVLYVLHQTQKERGDRNVPTAMLWGRVCEHFYISPEDLSEMLARLGARKGPPSTAREAGAYGVLRQRRDRMKVQLAHDVAAVNLDGRCLDAELLGDAGRVHAFGQELEHFALARAESLWGP